DEGERPPRPESLDPGGEGGDGVAGAAAEEDERDDRRRRERDAQQPGGGRSLRPARAFGRGHSRARRRAARIARTSPSGTSSETDPSGAHASSHASAASATVLR